MDALVQAALEKVQQEVDRVNHNSNASTTTRKTFVARAINAVDALKSALKAL